MGIGHITDIVLNQFMPIRIFKYLFIKVITVKAPNIAHLSLLTSVGYNKKETKMKKCAQPNKVIIIYYLHRVQNEKYITDL